MKQPHSKISEMLICALAILIDNRLFLHLKEDLEIVDDRVAWFTHSLSCVRSKWNTATRAVEYIKGIMCCFTLIFE